MIMEIIEGLFVSVVVLLSIIVFYTLGHYLWVVIAVAKFGLPMLTILEFIGLNLLICMLFPKFFYYKGEL